MWFEEPRPKGLYSIHRTLFLVFSPIDSSCLSCQDSGTVSTWYCRKKYSSDLLLKEGNSCTVSGGFIINSDLMLQNLEFIDHRSKFICNKLVIYILGSAKVVSLTMVKLALIWSKILREKNGLLRMCSSQDSLYT